MTVGWSAPDGPLLDDDLPPKVLRFPRTADERLVVNFLRRLQWRGDCLEWTGHVRRNGYGLYRGQSVHTFAFVFWFGSIPRKKLILHECDNGRCVSPYHLVAGDQSKNMSDMVARGRGRGGIRPGCIGELNNAAKVSVEQAQRALDLAEAGWWKSAIARMTGIEAGNVANIVKRRTWTHLTPQVGLYPPPNSLPSRWGRFEPGTKLP
jgi:hypothetical protein